METNEKLQELIEQAASGVTMLSPGEMEEIAELQAVFTQIDENLAQLTDSPADLVAQSQEASSEISSLLKKAKRKNAKDPESLIDAVTQEVMSLQSLVDQVLKAEPELEVEASAPVEEAVEEPQAAAGTVIDPDDVPLVQDFIAESNEHIESAEAGLLDLETKPDDMEVMNLIFRGFHTIKGMAGFLNLTDIGSLAHSTENLLDMARKGELVMSGENTDVVFESIDLLKKMIAELQDAMDAGRPVMSPAELPQLVAKIEVCLQNKSEAPTEPTDSQAESEAAVEEPVQESEPVETPAAIEEKVEEPVAEVQEESQPAAAPEVVVEKPVAKAAPAAKPEKTVAKAAAGTVDEKIKVSTDRLDKLVNMAGELVIAQLMVSEESCGNLAEHYELNRKVAHQGKIVRELQELSMSMRMVQIAGVFQKMNRLVRDVSRKAGKTIDFITEGEETELDRSIVDKIADPLIHMLRNSVDHGVEAPEDREKAGKSRTGRIELRAFHEAGNIVIEIEDDGKGLDKDRILNKAIENGVVDADNQLTDEQVYKLIFHAGLSTAQKVTAVSGRGVGMDVVKKNIESLRGKIDIASTQGKGTIFTIRLPLTLAMIDGQVVKVGQNRYIVPINSIIGTLRPQEDQISTVQNQLEMVLVRGELLPLIRLYNMFNVEPATTDPVEALLVIVEDDGKKCCMLVDDLLAQQRVVIKNLGEGLGKVEGVSGGAIMGDGKVSLILDVPSLMLLAQE
ncbi:MAG: chemotaxis protein CheA [Planctomycetota bacterium]|jgi:two-component system chemotaxis sensor kinase CheA